MPYSIKLSPSAIEDLKEAIGWYDSRLVSGLAQKFIEQLDATLNQLSIVPGKGSVRYKNIRCSMVNKFPYIIHYEVDLESESIIVFRIFCTFRKPLWE